MSRGKQATPLRGLAVWVLVTTGVLAAWSGLGGSAASLTAGTTWHGTFEDLLVAVAAAATCVCAGWLWLVTTATVVDVVRGRAPAHPPRGLTRRLVLVACGAAVVAGVGSPALAGVGARAGSAEPSLVGLPMPDRAVAPSIARPAPPPAPAEPAPPVTRATPAQHGTPGTGPPITVRAGDSLWTIAAARLGPGADEADIDHAWRELYAANRDAIGSDPDLIRPGLDLEPRPHREARP